MNTEVTPIPEVDSRLSNINRFYETQHEGTITTMIQNASIYCILSDTAVKTYSWWSTGTYAFDNMQEYWWFTVSSGQVDIPKDGIYYVGCMINRYQENIQMVQIELNHTNQKSSCTLHTENNNYGYSTLWFGNIIRLSKGEKIYITYSIQWPYSWSSYANTIGDYTQNKLMIFEMPTLSIN